MKKFFMAAALAVLSLGASAQDKYYGSEQGGFAFSINANPLLNYAGNLFNGTSNNSITDFEGVSNKLFNGVTITGKYMLKDNIALDLGLGWNNKYTTSYSFDHVDDPELRTALSRNNTSAFMLKVGGEYLLRPGKRLQPILGLDLVYVHENGWTYAEGLEHVAADKSATATEITTNYVYNGAPINKLGAMINVGVEYFLCQNISLGATVSLGVAKCWTSSSVKSDVPGAKDIKTTANTQVSLATGNAVNKTKNATDAGANISMNFYF